MIGSSFCILCLQHIYDTIIIWPSIVWVIAQCVRLLNALFGKCILELKAKVAFSEG